MQYNLFRRLLSLLVIFMMLTPAALAEDLVQNFEAYTQNGIQLTGDAPSDKLPYKVYLSKDSFTFAILGIDEQGEYTRPLRTFRTAIGTGNKTRKGSYYIEKKYDWYSWSWGGYTPYTCQMADSKIRLHATLHEVNEDFDSIYKGEYREIGTKSTQGCLRTTAVAAAWVFKNCDKGTEVYVANDALYTSEDIPAIVDRDPTLEQAENVEIPVTFFDVTLEELTLPVGCQDRVLVMGVAPETSNTEDFLFFSDNEAVVTVDEHGTMTAVAPGTARILVGADDVNRAYRIVNIIVK